MPARRRKSKNDRSYTAAHRNRRALLLPLAIGTRCPCRSCPRCQRRGKQCDTVMVDPRRMHLGHAVPLAKDPTPRPGDLIICDTCNTCDGASIGNRLRRDRRRSPKPPRLDTSRAW